MINSEGIEISRCFVGGSSPLESRYLSRIKCVAINNPVNVLKARACKAAKNSSPAKPVSICAPRTGSAPPVAARTIQNDPRTVQCRWTGILDSETRMISSPSTAAQAARVHGRSPADDAEAHAWVAAAGVGLDAAAWVYEPVGTGRLRVRNAAEASGKAPAAVEAPYHRFPGGGLEVDWR